jgi:hypothetical protein
MKDVLVVVVVVPLVQHFVDVCVYGDNKNISNV